MFGKIFLRNTNFVTMRTIIYNSIILFWAPFWGPFRRFLALFGMLVQILQMFETLRTFLTTVIWFFDFHNVHIVLQKFFIAQLNQLNFQLSWAKTLLVMLSIFFNENVLFKTFLALKKIGFVDQIQVPFQTQNVVETFATIGTMKWFGWFFGTTMFQISVGRSESFFTCLTFVLGGNVSIVHMGL